jgi:predicted ribosome quality control (RQC) complex YloA/Tae2 family protein
MFKNFFVLRRLVNELNNLAGGAVIESIFSQERNGLIIACSNLNATFYIEISAAVQNSYIILRNNYSRAKKNTIDFFSPLIRSRIKGISMSESDRIIKLDTSNGQLYFIIRGPGTNIFYVHNDSIQSFKKTPPENLNAIFSELGTAVFSNIKVLPDFSNSSSSLLSDFKKEYPQINKDMLNEAEARKNKDTSLPPAKILTSIIEEIYNNDFCIFSDAGLGRYYLAPVSFGQYSGLEKEAYSGLNEAIINLIKRQYYFSRGETSKKVIERYLNTELEKISHKLNNLKNRISKGSSEIKYSNYGNLLLVNLWKIHKGEEFVEIEDIYNNNAIIKIKLDAKLSPQKNADYYFDKSRSEKINFEKSKSLYSQLVRKFDFLLAKKDKLNLITDNKEYEDLKKELKIKTEDYKNSNENMGDKFKHYLVENKYDVYVGKDSTNNDLLTTKFAKQNDYWFHARGVPGSHVVLRVVNTKEAVPKNILKKTASLAAFHSKAKTAGVVPVSYTFKKYVIKKKGMEPGKVALLKEEVLLVRPEIPDGCEYQSTDLE